MAAKSKEEKLIPIIGLEIHCQLNKLKTKLFCSCNAQYRGQEPNKYICPVCLGLPGSLPVLNRKTIDFAITLALAFNSKINRRMYFFRKNYFYPDMAKNYQITQYNKAGGVAFADGGFISVKINNKIKKIVLDRFHLEEDPAKLQHIGGTILNSQGTLIDYNRSGIALVEIVTKPVLESPEEAREFLKKLRSIISHCGVSDLSLDGSMRVDANISIKGHVRTEVKNIGSFKDVEKALRWEILRQKKEIKLGREPILETRHFNGRTTSFLRKKESESDYRYFPEADLVPIVISEDWIEEKRKDMPELPDARIKRFQEKYLLNKYDSNVLVSEKNIADFYENTCKLSNNYQALKNWLMNDIMSLLNEQDLTIHDTESTPENLVEMVQEIEKGTVTVKIAKKYIEEMGFLKGIGIKKWLKARGIKKIIDLNFLSDLADKIIANNSNVLEDLKNKPRSFEFFMGQMMKETKGQASITLTRKILKEKLKKHIK
ncbi:MAG: Asp-tRNA(Asn)/Glu-tRNA(Gln) amidotransferase subunit GatB [Promethearchaeota archaeon]